MTAPTPATTGTGRPTDAELRRALEEGISGVDVAENESAISSEEARSAIAVLTWLLDELGRGWTVAS